MKLTTSPVINKLVFFQTKIIGNDQDFSLENKIYNAACSIAVIISAIGLVWNYYLNLSKINYISYSFILVIYSALYYYGRFKKHQYNSYIVISTLLILSITWFTTEGSNGSTLIMYLVAIIFFLAISKKKFHFKYLLITFFNIVILYILENQFYKELIITYPSIEAREADINFTYFISFIFIFLFLNFFKRKYESERITIRNQGKELEDNKLLFKSLFNNATIGLYQTTPEGKILTVNPTILKILKFDTIEEVLKRDISKRSYVNEEQREKFQKILSEKGEITEFESEWYTSTGEIITVREGARAVKDFDGKIIRYDGVIENITEQKRAKDIQNIILNISNASQKSLDLSEIMEIIQKELSRLVDTENFYIALYDEKNDTLHVPYYNDQKDNIVNFSAKKTITKLVIQEGKSLLITEAQILKLIEEGKVNLTGSISKIWLGIPLKIKGKVKGVFTVQSYSNPNAYSEKDKEILEIISHQISISIERKRHEEQLLNALELAQESDRLKSAFLANMSHEIRTPLNGVLGFSELLKTPNLSSENQLKYINIIEKSGKRLLTTITDIVDISKIEAGQIKVKYSNINIHKLTLELLDFFTPEASSKGIQLKLINSISEEFNITKCDLKLLNSILINLIKNAIKFTKQGNVTIGCFTNNNHIEFYIQDTGIGIPTNRQEQVFKRFIQADIEDIEVHEGSGLGLAISKSYVEILGGEIWLESEIGKGAKFSFKLPLLPKEGVKEINNEMEIESIKNSYPNIVKLLIVEDDEAAQIYLGEILKAITQEILYASSGLDAIETFKKNNDISLILMDIKLPDLNGYEVTKQIRNLNKNVVIIAQTAFAQNGDREKAISVGCTDYVSKPVSKDLLLHTINRYIKI